ncbi:hypothetical protein HYV85_00885 [Candidatus Woesearchaeota archaeon]|nr:hypothetical protein [Candidatus Woesearchaeota archaeon]
MAKEKRGLGYVKISVTLFHKNGIGIGNGSGGNGAGKTEPAPAMGNGSYSLYNVYNVLIFVSLPEADCRGHIYRIVQEAGITLLPETGRRSINPNELNGTGYAGTPKPMPQEPMPLSPLVAQQIREILEKR